SGATGAIYTSPNWAGLTPDREVFIANTTQATTSATVDPIGPPTDPIAVAGTHAGNGACVSLPAAMPPGAGWDFAVPRAFTLLGEPLLHLDMTVTGVDAEIDTRLWDVAEDGTRTLVTRGAYRFTGKPGTVSIDTALQGNGWDFASTHRIRLEVTQSDSPYLRTDNLPSTISYTSMKLTL